jgi:hypothetical protein
LALIFLRTFCIKAKSTKSYSTKPATFANYTHQLQFAPHEEGRIRAVRANPQDPITAFAYDYMLKDHLGNVRMVLTEEVKQNTYPAATLESIGNPGPALSYEQGFYQINAGDVWDRSLVPGLPNFNNNNGFDYTHDRLTQTQRMSTISQKLLRLNSTASKTGLGITLKVMPASTTVEGRR